MGSDRRARDILTELTTRRRLGERLWERVGQRGWGRPRVAVSDRIFKRFGLADPWDPTSRAKDEKPVGLGPVSLRLGPDRRQPAPHLKPKQPRNKKKRGGGLPRGGGSGMSAPSSSGGGPRYPPGFKPPVGVPRARQTDKSRPPPPPPKRPATELGREFGGGGGGPRGLVGKLPVRPEIAARMKAAADAKAAGKPPPKAAPPPPRPTPTKAAPKPLRSRKPRIMQRNPRLPPPPDDASAASASASASASAPPVNRRPPMPSRPAGKRRGRFSMRPTEVTAAPVVTELPDPVVEVVAAPEEAAPPAPPARPKAPVAAGGLDDLFGFAAQEGRMRLGGRKKNEK